MNESFEIIEQGSILIDGNCLAYVVPPNRHLLARSIESSKPAG
jgi:hypothetical protein